MADKTVGPFTLEEREEGTFVRHTQTNRGVAMIYHNDVSQESFVKDSQVAYRSKVDRRSDKEKWVIHFCAGRFPPSVVLALAELLKGEV